MTRYRSLVVGIVAFLLGGISLGVAAVAVRPDIMVTMPWTISGIWSFNAGKLVLNGSSSGSSILNAPATGGGTVTLPAGTGTLVYSGAVSATTVTVGSTLVAGGAAGRLLYDNAGTLGEPTMTASSGDLTLGSTTGPVGGSATMWGSTSGSLQIKPAAAAGTGSVLTLPGGTTDFSATGGTGQLVKQATAGGALTVGTVACAGLSNGATGCSTATGTSGATIPLLNGNNTWSKSQAVTPVALTPGAGSIAVDGSLSNGFTLTIGDDNNTLANPSNLIAGQNLNFQLTIGSGGHTGFVTGTNYKYATAPTWSTAAGKIDVLSCWAVTTSVLECTAIIDVH